MCLVKNQIACQKMKHLDFTGVYRIFDKLNMLLVRLLSQLKKKTPQTGEFPMLRSFATNQPNNQKLA